MRFDISSEIQAVTHGVNVGNVYNVRGGTGARHGHMMVIVSIVGGMATTLTFNKSGEIVSGSNYGLHYFEDKCPLAYCSGLEELSFSVERI